LLNRQVRIFRLGYRRDKRIQATRIYHLVSDATQVAIHPLWISPFQLRNTVNSEQFEIFEHCRTY
jgi:hypothetical protein